jgi:hypothetical protein
MPSPFKFSVQKCINNGNRFFVAYKPPGIAQILALLCSFANLAISAFQQSADLIF